MNLSMTALSLFALFTLLTLGCPLSSKITDKEENTAYTWNHKTKNTLRLVIVVMRHGDRAPLDTYPNDPYVNDAMAPNDWGQLTNEGRRHQYNQGVFLRKRYGRFLDSTYHPDIFYLQSTGVDRTKMSALLEAAALWKPNEKQTFKSDLPWQPVTLFYQERQDDTLMLVWNTCPRYTQLRSSVYDLPEVQKVHEDNKQLFAELSNFTGMPIRTFEDVTSLYGTLSAEESMNLTLPKWVKDYYPDKLLPLALYGLQLNTYNDEFRRLNGGPMLKKFTDDMLAKKGGTLKPGCTIKCPLDKFVEILKPMIPENWKEECKVDGNFTTPTPPSPIVLVL